MQFGRTLENSAYQPWKSNYIDYPKLKKLLRENDELENKVSTNSLQHGHEWTEDDEGTFVDELVNVQLEKVNAFQVDTYKDLRERTAECETDLARIASEENHEKAQDVLGRPVSGDKESDRFAKILHKLDGITKEINELEKYSRMNFTGFLKAAKKHDRRRGSQYRVRPLLQVRLAALPFNSEDYSPLLYQLSAMYSFVRQRIQGNNENRPSELEAKGKTNKYSSYKFWVHPENLLEVKTYILRRLPVLVYNPQSFKSVNGGQQDPRITSLYFDNASFSLYNDKVNKTVGASSLRLRWFGHLANRPEIFLEEKTAEESGDSSEIRLPIKEKYIQAFISGNYGMEKVLDKLRERQGGDNGDVLRLKDSVEAIRRFIHDNKLQPMLRANYTRTAFQIPGDERVRISLDTEIVLLREDCLDHERPCRDPTAWHRADIDTNEMEYPFPGIRQGEIMRFPYASLEIKVRDSTTRKTNEWVSDLMSSHLVKEAPRFSKFVHGVAQLFEDHVNTFPFWLSEMEVDIRRNPEKAFQEEQEKKAKHAEDEQAVGSLLGSKNTPAFVAAVGSPIGKSAESKSLLALSATGNRAREEASNEDDEPGRSLSFQDHSRLRSFLPSFSSSKYARSGRSESVRLPPGVQKPGRLIKDSGPVRVEPKVWLANQRTFIKWQHISILLATLSLSLYNAAGETNGIARGLAIVYTLVAGIAGLWGWRVYIVRSRMIEERNGKDFDSILGPIAISLALLVALCLNFGFQFNAMLRVSEQKHQDFHADHLRLLDVGYKSLQQQMEDQL